MVWKKISTHLRELREGLLKIRGQEKTRRCGRQGCREVNQRWELEGLGYTEEKRQGCTKKRGSSPLGSV